MPVSRRDIQVIQGQKAKKFEPVRTFEPGVLVSVEGGVTVSGRPGYVWCKEFNHLQLPPFQILNRRVPPLEGLKVKMGYPEKPPFERQIVDVWDGFGGLTGFDPIVLPTGNLHAQLHQYPTELTPGIDKVLIFQPALQPLKGLPSGSGFTIEVQHLEYWWAGEKVSFTGGTINVGAHLPTTVGNSVWVLVYLNTNSNLLAIEPGTESAGTPARPTLPEDGIPSVLVLLEEGQTSVALADIEDARFFILPAGNFDIDALPEQVAPTADEDYLAIYDVGEAEHRKVLIENLPITVTGGVKLLYSQTMDRTIANTTAETRLLESGRGSKILPANSLEVGTAIRLTLSGHLSTTGTPTLNIVVKLGGVELLNAGATALNSSVTEVGWQLAIFVTCRETGATGAVVASGLFEYDEGTFLGLVETTETVIDTTIENLIEAKAQWGTADLDNTITCQQATIEELSVTGLAPVGPSELEATETL